MLCFCNRTEINVQQLRDAPGAYIQNVLHQQLAFYEVCDANI